MHSNPFLPDLFTFTCFYWYLHATWIDANWTWSLFLAIHVRDEGGLHKLIVLILNLIVVFFESFLCILNFIQFPQKKIRVWVENIMDMNFSIFYIWNKNFTKKKTYLWLNTIFWMSTNTTGFSCFTFSHRLVAITWSGKHRKDLAASFFSNSAEFIRLEFNSNSMQLSGDMSWSK